MDWSQTLNLSQLEKANGLPSGILTSIMNAESGGNPNAVSAVGARGLFQFMPNTAKEYGIDPLDPQQAAQGAAKMLSDLSTKYQGDVPKVLAAYNWGQGNLDRNGLEKAPQETRDYIQKVQGGLPPAQETSNVLEKVLSGIGNAIVSPAQAEEMPQAVDQPQGKDLSSELFEQPKGQDLSKELFGETPKAESPKKEPLKTGTEAYWPELKESAGNAVDLAVEGTKQFGQGVSRIDPLANLKRLITGEKPEGSVLGGLADVGVGFGKAGLGALGAGFSPVDAAVKSFVGNPVENATGIPSGLTTFATELLAPVGIAKGISALSKLGKASEAAPVAKSALVKIAETFGKTAESGKTTENATVIKQLETPVISASSKDIGGLQKISESLHGETGKTYDEMRKLGYVFNKEEGAAISNAVDAALKTPTFIPELNPKTLAIVSKIKAAAKEGNLGLDHLDQYRKLLGRFGGTEDIVSSNAVRKAIDTAIDSAAKGSFAGDGEQAIALLNKGRAQHAQASKFDVLFNMVNKADGDPYKTQEALKRFIKNKENLIGFSKAEIQVLKDSAKNGIVGGTLKFLGKFGFDAKNVLIPSVTTFTGAGAPVAAAGTIARPISKIMVRSKMDKALNQVLNGKKLVPPKPKLSYPNLKKGGILATSGKITRNNKE